MGFRIEEPDGQERLKIPDTREIIIICGKSGSGKTVTMQMMAYQHYLDKFKVIYVTEKPQSAMENCFMMFPPKDELHIKNLQRQRFEHITGKEFDPLPIEIYHPFVFPRYKSNGLKESIKLPKEFKFFTFNINNLTRNSFSSILSLPPDSNSVSSCLRAISNNPPNLDIFNFVDNIFKGTKTKHRISIRNLGQTEENENKRDTRMRVKTAFIPFVDDFCLQPEGFKYNIDMKKILNNNKVTFLTYKFVADEKLKYFFQIHLLELIDNAIASEEIKKPILLILEEVKILLPKSISDQDAWQSILAQLLRKMLAGLRNQGKGVTTIASTQSYYETNKEFRAGSTEILLTHVNQEDMKAFKRDFGMSPDNAELLTELKRGQLVLFNEIIKRDERASKITIQMPPFANKMEGYSGFLNYYKKECSENLVSMKPLFTEMKELLNKQFEVQKDREKLYIEKKKESQKKAIKQKIVQIKIPKNQDKEIFVYNEIKNMVSAGISIPSYRDLGEKFSMNPITVRRIIITNALQDKDWELVDKFSTEDFVAKRMPQYYSQIFEAPRI